MLAEAIRPTEPLGREKPRIAPPLPARSEWKEMHRLAADLGTELFPWQDCAFRYMYAVGPGKTWLYPEVAVVVARQNGKTELLVSHIVQRLLMGRRIMHTAQNRELPREVFGRVAEVIQAHHRSLLTRKPRFANGQEEIRLSNKGHYRIVAPTRGGARGPSNDDLIIDEVRESESHDFIAAAKPTLNASPNPQVLYLSNAGDDSSEVLNALKKRSSEDPSLAYLEWSAAPERNAADVDGWLEANPSIGHMPQVLPNLEREYRAHFLAGTMTIFETEHLCRWVATMRERLVDEQDWNACEGSHEFARHGYLGVSVDPERTRASGVLAWNDDERVKVRLLFDVTGSPIDLGRLGVDVKAQAEELRVRQVGFDPLTDGELAKYFKNAVSIAGQKFKVASSTFVNVVRGKQLVWSDSPAITNDLIWTAKKEHDETGAFEAVRAKDDRPITASLAAIRAVGLASGPQPVKPRVY